MKTLFLHLSDMHIKSGTYFSNDFVQKIIDSIQSMTPFDYCCLIVSGDLSQSGKEVEYKRVKYLLSKLYYGITEKYKIDCCTLIVPGNHDMDFDNVQRNRSDISKIKQDGITPEIIEKEIEKFKNFYKFSLYYKCFKFQKLVDVKHIQVNGKTLQINMVNSELFSTFKDDNCDDDKGQHFLPFYELDKLSKNQGADYVITISHRGFEWFDWETEQRFRELLFKNTDIFFYGHEHIDNAHTLIKQDRSLISVISSGMDFEHQMGSYSAICLNLDNGECVAKQFVWDSDNSFFDPRITNNFITNPRKETDIPFNPNQAFLKDFVCDDHSLSVSDYFVFPGVIRKSDEKEITDFEEFINYLINSKQSIISGDDFSGKTVLLKQIYLKLIGKKIPIYLSTNTLKNRKIEKAIKEAFETQYSNTRADYEKFLQLDSSKIVILLDDIGKLKEKSLEIVEKYIIDKYPCSILTSASTWTYDLTDYITEQEKISCTYTILPFYSTKRLELIRRLSCVYRGEDRTDEKEIQRINNRIHDQVKIFSLNPYFINMYMNCYLINSNLDHSNQNVFGQVFENNLVNAIRKEVPDCNVDEYSVLLEEIAFQIHFTEQYPLPFSQIVAIIEKYNSDNLMDVNIRVFCETLVRAHVLEEENNNYSFSDNNYLAYFVAKSLNSKCGSGESINELQKVSENLCFNINAEILIFLSYITSNMSILEYIRKAAEEHFCGLTEFDLDSRNIGFITNSTSAIVVELPTDTDKEESQKRKDTAEKRITQRDKLEVQNMYEYDKELINTKAYKISKAFKYTELICKILPAFNHRLNREQKELYVMDALSFPNKIIYMMNNELDVHFEEIVETLTDFCAQNNISLSKEQIKRQLEKQAETLILNVYDWCARLVITPKTLIAFNQIQTNSLTYRIQRVMMLENLGDFKSFSKELNELYDNTELPVIKSMLKRIVYKHFLYNDLKMVGQVESFASKFFGNNAQNFRYLKKKNR